MICFGLCDGARTGDLSRLTDEQVERPRPFFPESRGGPGSDRCGVPDPKGGVADARRAAPSLRVGKGIPAA